MKFVHLLITILISATCLAQTRDYSFEVEGTVKGIDGELLTDFTVTVYEKGKVIYETVPKDGTFFFAVAIESEAMIEISADGFYSKRIAFKSKPELITVEVPVCELDMVLYNKEDYPELAELEDVMDMPVAFLAYDRFGNVYDINEEQSNALKLLIVSTIRESRAMAKF